MSESRFHEIKASGQLPSPTGTALKLLELTRRDDVTITEITRLLQTDPALSGRLIKFANSPFIGKRRPVGSISEAVLLVGIQTVRHLVLGLSVMSRFRSGRCESFDYRRFWAGSLATAVINESLCAHDGTYPPEEAFTLGLLSRVGQLALASVYPVEYGAILDSADTSDPEQMLDMERERLLTDHVELTVAMLQDWGLPDMHLIAVKGIYDRDAIRHEKPRAAKLGTCLNVAAGMANAWLGEAGPREIMTAAIAAEASSLGFDAVTFSSLHDEAIGRWHDWATILEVETTEVPAFFESLEKAHAQASQASDGQPAPDSEKLRILIVENESSTRDLLRAQLGVEGHEVFAAADGRDGLHLALEIQPHIVITDWTLPEMNGAGFCSSLRSTREGQRIYVIVLTAQESESCVVEAFGAGVDDYMVKPVVPRILRTRLRASQRLVALQQEVYREQDENRRNLAELALANRRLEQTALTDVLTNLPNRRHAVRRLEQVWSAAVRTTETVTLMLVDVDHFKAINDTYGHAHGDRILAEVATVLRTAARNDDEVCRIGGEEFMVICNTQDAGAAQIAAERLRLAIEHHIHGLKDYGNKLTISIGLAVLPAKETDPDRLMRIADQALYQAKRLGRNRVCVSVDPQGLPGRISVNSPAVAQAAQTVRS
jgi:diguanylate cyclase (GGDEF)-like protein